jgi:Tfp pilus assembly protein PilO
MKKYFSQLRPLERRLVVGVAVVLVVVLNWVFIWPEFSDASNYETRLDTAQRKLKNYQANVAQIPDLRKQLSKYENEGEYVPAIDVGISFIRTVQQQAVDSGVALQNAGHLTTHTNDQFFIEQEQNINVLAAEAPLVDFLYKLGSSSSMMRVRDLTLQPDPPRQRLSADIRLVASYQKNPTAPAASNATAKAK